MQHISASTANNSAQEHGVGAFLLMWGRQAARFQSVSESALPACLKNISVGNSSVQFAY
jgi:hypothetical protein